MISVLAAVRLAPVASRRREMIVNSGDIDFLDSRVLSCWQKIYLSENDTARVRGI